MSLVPNYVKFDDGNWYKNPTLGEGEDWFLCFDDDEDDEIVVDRKLFFKGLTFEKIVEKLGIPIVLKGTHYLGSGCSRCFNKNWLMKTAVRSFAMLRGHPPVKYLRDYDSLLLKKPDRDGVYFDWDEAKNRIDPEYDRMYAQVPPTKAERILKKVQARVGGELKTSKKGTPHLVIGGVGGRSVCYFGLERRVVIFSGYGTLENCREAVFKEWPQAATYIEQENN